MGIFSFFKKKKKTYVNKRGYIMQYNPDSPDARNNGFSPIHRDVARKKIRREILPGEVVHHKNRDKQDNRPRNLEVMTAREHNELHGIQYSKKKPRASQKTANKNLGIKKTNRYFGTKKK